MRTREYRVPAEDPEVGHVEPSEWLNEHMNRVGMTNAALLKAIQDLGYEGGSQANVINWRKQGSKLQIPPEAFPKICIALGFPADKTDYWTCDVLKQAYPDLKPFIRDPLEEKKQRFLARQTGRTEEHLRALGRDRKKETLKKQLSELED
ncbi:hypothetical protein AA309_12030 [Microvirga vignae]|uniref:Uncharacterized protein n=1 Tax=Microvirga vignae TaxID=1225564 RepID=A0A0H1RJR8_9HYPH|nr:hypothetical protein [Microvirga vignae]KLK92847.1 hypothetical protein AA309_12030 [Microvirga vignae]